MVRAPVIFRGCTRGRRTGTYDLGRQVNYMGTCPYCSKEFEASRRQLRDRSKAWDAAHCGCQTKERQSATNSGRKPVNLLDDRTATVRLVLRASSAKECTLGESDVAAMIFQPCHYCGEPPNHYRVLGSGRWRRQSTVPSHGIDRMDSSKGYVPGNCVTCCTTCNYMKREQHYDDFIGRVCRIASLHSN